MDCSEADYAGLHTMPAVYPFSSMAIWYRVCKDLINPEKNIQEKFELTACSVWQANTFLEGPALLLIPWQSVASPIPQVFYLLIPNLMSVSKTTQIFMFQHTCPRASCLQSPLSKRGGGSKKQILTLPTLSIEGCPYAKR